MFARIATAEFGLAALAGTANASSIDDEFLTNIDLSVHKAAVFVVESPWPPGWRHARRPGVNGRLFA